MLFYVNSCLQFVLCFFNPQKILTPQKYKIKQKLWLAIRVCPIARIGNIPPPSASAGEDLVLWQGAKHQWNPGIKSIIRCLHPALRKMD